MLIACKMEINYSKRASSMLKFTAIDENGEVACDDEAVALLQSGRMKGDYIDTI